MFLQRVFNAEKRAKAWSEGRVAYLSALPSETLSHDGRGVFFGIAEEKKISLLVFLN